MIIISITVGAVTGCCWLYYRLRIKNRITRNTTVILTIPAAVCSVVALSKAKRYPLKRYKLEVFYSKEFIWCANHLATTLVMLFEKQGQFLLSPTSVAELSLLVPLPKTEKEVIVKVIVYHIQKIGSQKISAMITSSILVGDYVHYTYAFTYLENILETKRLKELVLEAK